jgi:hypothetical protein
LLQDIAEAGIMRSPGFCDWSGLSIAIGQKHPFEETTMKNLQKLFASILLGLVLGLPVCAGDMNSPPAPGPPPCTITAPDGTLIPDPACTAPSPAGDTGTVTVIINLLARVLSI